MFPHKDGPRAHYQFRAKYRSCAAVVQIRQIRVRDWDLLKLFIKRHCILILTDLMVPVLERLNLIGKNSVLGILKELFPRQSLAKLIPNFHERLLLLNDCLCCV